MPCEDHRTATETASETMALIFHFQESPLVLVLRQLSDLDRALLENEASSEVV